MCGEIEACTCGLDVFVTLHVDGAVYDFLDSKVLSEVKKVMQPLPSSSGSSSGVCKYTSTRQRRKRKMSTFTKEKKKDFFQKKLVVFNYMPEKEKENSFTRKESDIILRGLLPEISLNSTENEVRDAILSLLHNSSEFNFDSFTTSDFHFIDVNGKQASVPVFTKDQEITGRIIKQIAGLGAVYVRLSKPLPPRSYIAISDESDLKPAVKHRIQFSDSDSSFELPAAFQFTGNASTSIPPTSNTSIVSCSSSSSGSTNMDTSQTAVAPATPTLPSTSSMIPDIPTTSNVAASNTTPMMHEIPDSVVEDPPSPPPAFIITYSPPRAHASLSDIQKLQNIHSNLTATQVQTVYEISNSNFEKASRCLENLTLNNLLNLVYSKYIDYATEESPQLRISKNYTKTDLCEVLMGFYKSSRFVHNSCVRIRIQEENVLDSGGVHRQMFSDVFGAISEGHLQLFSSPVNRLTPIFKPSNIVSGLTRNFGKAVAHSLVMDQIGFPHLSPPIYYYLIGMEDVAITLLRDTDATGQAAHVLSRVMNISSTYYSYTFITLVAL